MSTVVGAVGPFEGNQEEWMHYVERVKFFCVANGITDTERKKAVLLSVCGVQTYKLIRNLLAPGKPEDAEYDDIVAKVKDHVNPKPSTVVQRFRFNSRSQKPGESVVQFMAELRRFSTDCDFGDTLADMLRDRLVCGVSDGRIQRRLLQEKELTFDKALSLARAMETAALNAEEIQRPTGDSLEGEVHKMQETKPSLPKMKCFRCLGFHPPNSCYAQRMQCHKCKKVGHLARACRGQRQPGQARNEIAAQSPVTKTHRVETTPLTPKAQQAVEEGQSDDGVEGMYTVYVVGKECQNEPLAVTVHINKKAVQMEVDTGASVSIVSESTYKKLWKRQELPGLRRPQVRLHTYSGEPLTVLGELDVRVRTQNQIATLPLIVVRNDGPNLLGRNWMKSLVLPWHEMLQKGHIKSIGTETSCTELLKRFDGVFEEGIGELKGTMAAVKVKEGSAARFFKPRPVPYAYRAKVEHELKRLEAEGIIEPVRFANWAAPIVPILKADGSIRICGDYRLTVNQVAETEKYPLPRVEDIFASLAGGQTFTKLDLSHAYQQVKLEEQSKQYLVINTHLGLFQYNRLPFGVAAAPAIFQRIMDCLLQGIPGTVVYLDDILITGRSQEEHLRNLEAVLSRLAGARIRLERQKCSFLKREIQYLGHRIDSKGIYPTDEKVQAVRAAPEPTDVGQLRAYLGLINYYGRFLPGLAKTLAPLYKLLRQGMNWRWGEEEKTAFRCSKAALQSDKLLVHYDPRIPLSLACDASPVGIGAVLSHQYPDGGERPIAYASRSLTKAEQGYAQIDREALSVVFGVKRFRQYVFGHQFTIFTDHKPLLTLLGENRGVPAMCSGRVQRWSLMLSSYQYTMTYRPGSLNSNADGLSRLPSSGVPDEEEEPVEAVLALQTLSSSSTKPITAVQIRRGTERDPVLSQVRQYTLTGWPSVVERADIRPYFNRRYELSVSGGCVFWGGRVVVPPQTRSSVLEELHVSHPGETRMKGLARSFVWWPGIDKELERVVKGCHTCQVHRKLPALAPLHPWAQADRAWSRLHIDFAGPFLGQSFLIVVDAYSKWLEVDTMTSTTARVTIKKLQRLFATHGIPEIVVSDNGAAFTSAEFRQFMEGNGIKHIYSAPYHPSSNGLAERAVATFKGAMKRMNSEYGSLESKIDRFLLRYRITPHATTGEPPALLLLGRMPRSRLDLLRPDLAAYTYKKQEQQRNDHDKRSRDRTFEVGQLVYVKNFGQGTPWVMATVKERTGPLSFRVMLPDGRMLRRHQDHIRSRQLEDDPLPNGTHTDPTASPPESNMTEELPSIEVTSEPGGSISETNGDHGGQGETVGHEATSNMEPASTGVRRSARARKAPDRLDL
ncbi:uncharacterized protein K02A2.6-like [Corticium candelabrum]|uniref:uncharacterized protein K02A2.6-like n=3 Tax=Corticium candelabrum TaxID=121492 RepID=UPI002E252D63|nr:uncharacterized protein K02A2.6-like [Corticium candelabrum]